MGPTIAFFEKPGCKTNRRQQALLRAAGYEPLQLNLLTHPWQVEELRSYLASLPVTQWFNTAAPAVRDGEIDPAGLDADTALAMLLAEPLLIRRPLLEFEGRRMAGFDEQRLEGILGIRLAAGDSAVEACSRRDPATAVCP
ncbi:hypothetical protein E4634_03415 [Mangrovimicrobium sediminis]|uniref:Nitrogenase-associated protein n=1 Tax=Mangrovimicrobium sediminis TaxID=2562682 RepID=A0A4Z0M5X3_9GAMM|nr:ArsC/Spx/MgsR family protein [Haliea sp. SAOS-164]TGD75073.1 hypothetical protein E4634_03415 [Haliea sp. SAOS-164]